MDLHTYNSYTLTAKRNSGLSRELDFSVMECFKDHFHAPLDLGKACHLERCTKAGQLKKITALSSIIKNTHYLWNH